MSPVTLILIVLVILLVLGLPTWPYAANWGYGYYPSGAAAIIVVILLILLLTGRL
jgi:hypothetical protein